MSNDLWWVPAMEREIEMLEAAIQGRQDHEMVRLPLGDAGYEPVKRIRIRVKLKRGDIARAKAPPANVGEFFDGPPTKLEEALQHGEAAINEMQEGETFAQVDPAMLRRLIRFATLGGQG